MRKLIIKMTILLSLCVVFILIKATVAEMSLPLLDNVLTYSPEYLPGIEVLAETSVRVTSEEQSFVWKDYGLRLYIPQGSLPAGHTHCCFKIRAAISGQFQFPEGSRPVSVVYWLSSDLKEDFFKYLTLEIQHCAKQSAVGELEVVTAATTSHTLPYQFQRLKGGVFSAINSYGSIQLNHFCLLCLISKSLYPLTYYSRIYYTEKKKWRCTAHVAITQNLHCPIKVSA